MKTIFESGGGCDVLITYYINPLKDANNRNIDSPEGDGTFVGYNSLDSVKLIHYTGPNECMLIPLGNISDIRRLLDRLESIQKEDGVRYDPS